MLLKIIEFLVVLVTMKQYQVLLAHSLGFVPTERNVAFFLGLKIKKYEIVLMQWTNQNAALSQRTWSNTNKQLCITVMLSVWIKSRRGMVNLEGSMYCMNVLANLALQDGYAMFVRWGRATYSKVRRRNHDICDGIILKKIDLKANGIWNGDRSAKADDKQLWVE